MGTVSYDSNVPPGLTRDSTDYIGDYIVGPFSHFDAYKGAQLYVLVQ